MELVDAQIREPHPFAPWPFREESELALDVELAREAMDCVGVNAALINASAVFCDAAVERYLDRFASCIHADLNAEDVDTYVGTFRDRPGRLALRVVIRRWTDGQLTDEYHRQERHEPTFAAAERHGVPLFLTPSAQIPSATKIARTYPELILIIDHLGLLQQPTEPHVIGDDPWVDLDSVIGCRSSLTFLSSSPVPRRWRGRRSASHTSAVPASTHRGVHPGPADVGQRLHAPSHASRRKGLGARLVGTRGGRHLGREAARGVAPNVRRAGALRPRHGRALGGRQGEDLREDRAEELSWPSEAQRTCPTRACAERARMLAPRRSCLVVPANAERMVAKARRWPADEVIIDLEDAVAAAERTPELRDRVAAALRADDWRAPIRAVRVNALGTPWFEDDVTQVLCGAGDRVHSLVVPKVESVGQLALVDELLLKLERDNRLPPIAIDAQIETALGLTRVDEIAASVPRLAALVVGAGDFAASLGLAQPVIGAPDPKYPGDRWHYARSRIASPPTRTGSPPSTRRTRRSTTSTASSRRRATHDFVGKWAIHRRRSSRATACSRRWRRRSPKPSASSTSSTARVHAGEGASADGAVMGDEASRRAAAAVLARAVTE